MSWIPNPNAIQDGPTLVTVAIPASLYETFEACCEWISVTQAESSNARPEDIIAILGLRAAETLINKGQFDQLFAEAGEHDDRP